MLLKSIFSRAKSVEKCSYMSVFGNCLGSLAVWALAATCLPVDRFFAIRQIYCMSPKSRLGEQLFRVLGRPKDSPKVQCRRRTWQIFCDLVAAGTKILVRVILAANMAKLPFLTKFRAFLISLAFAVCFIAFAIFTSPRLEKISRFGKKL